MGNNGKKPINFHWLKQQNDISTQQIKKLIATIISFSFKELNYCLKRLRKGKSLPSHYDLQREIQFWTEDAYTLAAFIIGDRKAKLLVNKAKQNISEIESLIKRRNIC